MKLKVNGFTETKEVLYFLTEARINIAFAVVDEQDDTISYYQVCVVPEFDKFANVNRPTMMLDPKGERIETGEPAIGSKSKLSEGIFGGHLDITKDKDEVYFILTGKRRPAIKTNAIG